MFFPTSSRKMVLTFGWCIFISGSAEYQSVCTKSIRICFPVDEYPDILERCQGSLSSTESKSELLQSLIKLCGYLSALPTQMDSPESEKQAWEAETRMLWPSGSTTIIDCWRCRLPAVRSRNLCHLAVSRKRHFRRQCYRLGLML